MAEEDKAIQEREEKLTRRETRIAAAEKGLAMKNAQLNQVGAKLKAHESLVGVLTESGINTPEDLSSFLDKKNSKGSGQAPAFDEQKMKKIVEDTVEPVLKITQDAQASMFKAQVSQDFNKALGGLKSKHGHGVRYALADENKEQVLETFAAQKSQDPTLTPEDYIKQIDDNCKKVASYASDEAAKTVKQTTEPTGGGTEEPSGTLNTDVSANPQGNTTDGQKTFEKMTKEEKDDYAVKTAMATDKLIG